MAEKIVTCYFAAWRVLLVVDTRIWKPKGVTTDERKWGLEAFCAVVSLFGSELLSHTIIVLFCFVAFAFPPNCNRRWTTLCRRLPRARPTTPSCPPQTSHQPAPRRRNTLTTQPPIELRRPRPCAPAPGALERPRFCRISRKTGSAAMPAAAAGGGIWKVRAGRC